MQNCFSRKLLGTQANVYTLRSILLTVCFKGKTLKKPDIILRLKPKNNVGFFKGLPLKHTVNRGET